MDSGNSKISVEPHERLEEGGHYQGVQRIARNRIERERTLVVATIMTLSLTIHGGSLLHLPVSYSAVGAMRQHSVGAFPDALV